MSKQLIVNADDFGRHILINRAVERGVAQGLIRSATVMVTAPRLRRRWPWPAVLPPWAWASISPW